MKLLRLSIKEIRKKKFFSILKKCEWREKNESAQLLEEIPV